MNTNLKNDDKCSLICKNMNKIFKFIIDIFACKNELEKKKSEKKLMINIKKYKILIISLLFFIAILFFIEPIFECYFIENKDAFKDLKTFLVTISAGLVGLTAIIFTLIIFSMQTNLEKLPFGLFKNFSSDKKLMFYLGMMLTLSILIGILSLIQDITFSGWICDIFLIFIISIYSFIYLSFKRGLRLINPIEQLNMIIEDTEKNLNFEKNIHYVDSIIKRNLDVLEYEVSTYSLNTLISINSIYIQKKGKTFYGFNSFNPDDTNFNDLIINSTLERLRVNFSIFLRKNDEMAIEQILSCYVELIKVYESIEYYNNHDTKIHSNIASSHLIDDIEKLFILKNPDLLMRSIKKLEVVSIFYIEKGLLLYSVRIYNSIGRIGLFVISEQSLNFVLQTVMNYFTNIIKKLLLSNADISYTLEELNKEIVFILKSMIGLQISNYNYYVGDYYSHSKESLTKYLIDLGNYVFVEETIGINEKNILDNILIFAEESYQMQKELFNFALEHKSLIIDEVLSMIVNISLLCIKLPKLNYRKKEFLKWAKWYLSIISFIPKEKESIKYMSIYGINERLFILGKNCIKHDSYEIIPTIIELMINWSFKVGKYADEEIYEMVLGLLGTSYLSIKSKNEELITLINENLTKYNLSNETINYVEAKLNIEPYSFMNDIEETVHKSNDDEELCNLLEKIKEIFKLKNSS